MDWWETFVMMGKDLGFAFFLVCVGYFWDWGLKGFDIIVIIGEVFINI